jgi:hypothetical protein
LDHDRIFAAPFDEHVDNLAHYWAGARDRGEYVAITTTTNDHVDAINTAVHDHRRRSVNSATPASNSATASRSRSVM